VFGEQCDDGVNDGSYGGCNDNCSLGPRCGDGVLQAGEGEECDDGNLVGGDSCNSMCKLEIAQ
jgi:cysteine-rich repeat protein